VAVLRSGFLLYRAASRRCRRARTLVASPSPHSEEEWGEGIRPADRRSLIVSRRFAMSLAQEANWPSFRPLPRLPRPASRLAVGRGADIRVSGGLHLLQKGPGHLFVTGRAGTGKSTLLTSLKELIADEMVILAPTGLRCGQRRRPDHPLVLRLPAAADPALTTSVAAATAASCAGSSSWSSTRCRWCAPT
jgi:hypothetical protein